MWIIEHGPKNFEIEGGGFHGFFESAERGLQWLNGRLSGEPYNPIPQEGEL